MPSPDARAPAWPSRSVALLAVCIIGLILGWPRPSDAQAPSQSEREGERRRLLDQLGLKKRPAPVAPSSGAANEEGEKDEEGPGEPSPPGSQPPAKDAAPEAKPAGPAVLVFDGRVHRALLGACRSCHGAGGMAAKSAYVLDGTLDADFAATRRYVKAGQPEQSSLLRLASGDGHKGGPVLPPGSAGFQLLSRWIRDGAARGAAAPAAAAAVSPQGGGADASVLPSPSAVAPRVSAAPTVAASSPVPAPASSVAPVGAALGAPGQLAYAPTVHDALSQSCAGCHRSGAPAGATGYVLTGDVAADFASARRFVDLERPEASPLLRKASGAPHAGGAPYPVGSDAYLLLLHWIQFGASGPTDAAVITGPSGAALAPPPASPAAAAAVPVMATQAAHPSMPAPHGTGVSLPFNFRLNGRFDLSYERRNFDTQPFSSGGDDVLTSYHHFLFLSRQTLDDPIGFTAELINLTFWEANYHLSLPEALGQLWIKAGKLLVPFGPDPLFHQSYGGLVGFDQRVLPAIWAQEGLSARFSREDGELSSSADLYVLRGHELRQRDAVLNLQSDLSPLESAHLAVGGRLRASWKALSVFYSGYVNRLGFGRGLYLQALDVAVWRLRGVPVLERLAGEVGLMRADISGAGPGQDYYHFASYFRLRYFLTDLAYVQYRQGVRTFDNRRGVIQDDTRLTREDGSTHNFGVVSRHGPLTFGLYYFFNLEKADEVDDDFLRIAGVYEF